MSSIERDHGVFEALKATMYLSFPIRISDYFLLGRMFKVKVVINGSQTYEWVGSEDEKKELR